jgi:hypothetical protein
MWLPIRYILGTDHPKWDAAETVQLIVRSSHLRTITGSSYFFGIVEQHCFIAVRIELYPTRERPRTWGFSRLGAVKTSTHE